MIGAVNGYCFAGGLEVALTCHFLIGAESSEYGVLNRRWAVPLVDGGTYRLPLWVGLGNALYLIQTGARINAAEAYRMGLIQQLVPDDQLLPRARELAAVMATVPQSGLNGDTQSVLRNLGRDYGDALSRRSCDWRLDRDVGGGAGPLRLGRLRPAHRRQRRVAGPVQPMTDQALGGLRVVELGAGIPAAYATKLLADLGADVIKVEPPGGDPLRLHGPFPNDEPHLRPARSTSSLTPTSEASRPIWRMRTGAPGCSTSRATPTSSSTTSHPATWNACASSTPTWRRHGQTSSWSRSRRSATTRRIVTGVATRSSRRRRRGLVHRIGDPGREPLALPFAAADFQGGVHGAVTALAALRARRLTGRGQHAWIATTEIIARSWPARASQATSSTGRTARAPASTTPASTPGRSPR